MGGCATRDCGIEPSDPLRAYHNSSFIGASLADRYVLRTRRRNQMTTLPTKSESSSPTEVEVIPTWRELGERFRDVMKDIGVEISKTWKKEGKDLEKDLKERLLPALNRAKIEIDKLITRLEERNRKL
jgi:hypothetical protein